VQLPLLDAPEAGLRLSFVGKENARQLARRVRPRVMATVAKYSLGSNEDQANSLVVEGDNLQAMVTLYKERGQVDLILTDPPYNTGKDFRYNDKWEEDPNDVGLGELVSSDDGARHTKWMRFMWPRLQMMKAMLKQSGVLAICIDHRELFHLGQMLDELFGEKNRLGIINWQKNYSPKGDSRHLSTATEYILVYARDESRAITGLQERGEAALSRYACPDSDPKGLWTSGDATATGASDHQKMVYAIQSPFSGELFYPALGAHWRMSQKQMFTWLSMWGVKYQLHDLDDDETRRRIIGASPSADIEHAKGIVLATPLEIAITSATSIYEKGPWPPIYFTKSGFGGPRYKRYLNEVKSGTVPMTFLADETFDADPEYLGSVSWEHEVSGHSQTGINELDSIVGKGHGFQTVKPVRLFERVIQLWCPPDGLVLDTFAGSGTTGHAVLKLNSELGFSRRFTLIEQGRPERGDSYARTLLADRLRRVSSGKWASGQKPGLAGGFTFVALRNRVDADTVLRMERDEMVDTVIASYFDASKRKGSGLVRVDPNGHRYLVARSIDGEGFFLVWDGPKKNTDFTEDVYLAVANEAKDLNLKPVYNVYARFNLYQTDNVRFYQIPDRILADFGLDLRSEPYYEVEDA
jgi:adenine-specific DNA-methyltransferase